MVTVEMDRYAHRWNVPAYSDRITWEDWENMSTVQNATIADLTAAVASLAAAVSQLIAAQAPAPTGTVLDASDQQAVNSLDSQLQSLVAQVEAAIPAEPEPAAAAVDTSATPGT